MRQRSIYPREAFSSHIPGHEGSCWRKGGGDTQRSYLVYPSFTSARGRSRVKSQVCKCRFSTLPLHFITATLRNCCLGKRRSHWEAVPRGVGSSPKVPGSLWGSGAFSDQLQIGAFNHILELCSINGTHKGPTPGAAVTRHLAFIKKKKIESGLTSLKEATSVCLLSLTHDTGQLVPPAFSPKSITLKPERPLE